NISLALVGVFLGSICVVLMGVMRVSNFIHFLPHLRFNCMPHFLHQWMPTPPQVHLLMSPKPISFLIDWSLITATEGCTPVCWAGPFFGEN
ncbi:hypothetical protein BKA82DRAFT_4192830, partial [Pisolithus tinctorius]